MHADHEELTMEERRRAALEAQRLRDRQRYPDARDDWIQSGWDVTPTFDYPGSTPEYIEARPPRSRAR
jgi:hypothetical protein